MEEKEREGRENRTCSIMEKYFNFLHILLTVMAFAHKSGGKGKLIKIVEHGVLTGIQHCVNRQHTLKI